MRARLFLVLMIATGFVWLSAVAWINFSTRAEVERVLDARLTEAARMVSSLVASQEIDPRRAAQIPLGAGMPHTSYDRQLSCQIWALDGKLVGRSDGAPRAPLTASVSGFSETSIDGDVWRVYAVENSALGVRVLVGDNLRVRDRLVGDVIKGLLLPASLIMPILAGLIWLSVRKGLAPLKRVASALSARGASDLGPLAEDDSVPSEIRPVIKSLNGLFARVASARERERNFTAFAAHELRTPLAGLKTQAQVALGASDAGIQKHALGQIMLGVDRTSRLIRQLLDIAEIEASETIASGDKLNAGHALAVLGNDLATHAHLQASIVIDRAVYGLWLEMETDLFMLAARNLLENALSHSPDGGVVLCRAVEDHGRCILAIEDEGPGIPVDELPRVTERFFRGRNKAAIGSGLGLAIVELALARVGGALTLSNRPEGGLRAAIQIDAGRFRIEDGQCARPPTSQNGQATISVNTYQK